MSSRTSTPGGRRYWWAQFVEAELLPLRPDTSPFGALRVNKEAFGRSVAVVISRCFGLKRARAHSMVRGSQHRLPRLPWMRRGRPPHDVMCLASRLLPPPLFSSC